MNPRATLPDVSTRDESDWRPGSPTVDDDAQYEFKDVRALRGTESRTKEKWKKDGWELVTQNQGTLRTEMTFRRVKPKTLGTYLWAFVAPGQAAFRRLDPVTRLLLLAVSAGFVVIVVIIGIVVAIQSGSGTPEPSASPTEATVVPSDQSSGEPIQEPEAPTYDYQGPHYEIVAVDEDTGPAGLNQYWVYTGNFDFSTDAYKDQVKMIVADIAHHENTAKLIVEVVTDKEVIEAESASTIAGYMAEHDADYIRDVLVPKEESDWVASYRGGLDADTGQASESASAFEVIWWSGAAPEEFEKWRPETAG